MADKKTNKKLNEADGLLQRVFKVIGEAHFKDYKMIPHYTDSIRFPRSLGDDLAAYIRNYHNEYYFNRRQIDG